MDINLYKKLTANLPKMNEKIVEGLAVSQMEGVEKYIHDILCCAAESFPVGLKYHGFKRCTPLEYYKEITRPLNPKRMFDLAQSDVYLVNCHFSYKGVDLRPQYLYLPFVREAGILFLKNTRYN